MHSFFVGHNCACSVATSGEGNHMLVRLNETQLLSASILFRINCKCTGSLSRYFSPQVELHFHSELTLIVILKINNKLLLCEAVTIYIYLNLSYMRRCAVTK